MIALASIPGLDLGTFSQAALGGIVAIVVAGAVFLGLLIWVAFSR